MFSALVYQEIKDQLYR